ncbi:M56 family metallopeptidase [Flavobacterium sp. RHBU_24]|uniref:M56 family metallopeptidase n=1 Tax=Flavobacterium sp. RHBU_24 TaxID=3391185 RepID=UPI0039846FF4
MDTLLLYALKSSALLALFYLAYQLLKKETFFNANRVFLLMGLISATLLPLAVFTKTIWVTPRPQQPLSNADMALLMAAMKNKSAQPDFQLNWLYIVLGIYVAGMLFFGIKLLADIYKVRAMVKGKNLVRQERYKLVDSHDVEAPFSFFNYIVYNSNALQPQELESIISHEKVHSRQKHSVDMLAAQAYCILFWFNPVAWLYRKAISQNLEFIADAEAAIQVTDRTAYQKTMLRLSVQPQQIAIINHFYQSLIKKRIVMLNKQRSHRRNSWKFAVVLPLLAAFMMAFQVKTVAREKTGTKTITQTGDAKAKEVETLEITKDTGDDILKKYQDELSAHGAEASFTNVNRNEQGEITGIRIEVKGNDINRLYDIDGTEPITTIYITVVKQSDAIKEIHISPSAPKTSKYLSDSGDYLTRGDTVIVTKRKVITSPASPLTPLDPLAPLSAAAPPAKMGYSSGNGQNIAMNTSDNTLIVVNGVKQQKGEPVYIPHGQDISAVNVIKGKDAKKKYGKEAKDGAIEITTAGPQNGHVMVVRPDKAFTFEYDAPMVTENSFSWSTGEMPDFDFEINADNIRATMDMVLKNKMEIDMQMDTDQNIIMLDANADAMTKAGKILEENAKRLQSLKSREDMEQAREEIKKARADMMRARDEIMKEHQQIIKEHQQILKEHEKATQKAKAAKATRKA